MYKREGITFFRRKVFVSKSRKKLRGTLLCSNEILVMTTIMHMKWSSQFCCYFLSHCTETFVERTIVFDKFSGMEKKTIVKGWYHVFLSKTSGFAVPKAFVRGTLVFQKSSGRENIRWIRGSVSRFSDESFLSHSVGKKLGGNVLCLNEILVKETFMHRMGVVTFVRIFLTNCTEKIRRDDPCVSEKFW